MPYNTSMQDHLQTHQEQFPAGGSGDSPDPLSRDLQRRTAVVAVALLVGAGSGIVSLLFAGHDGGLTWLGFTTLGIAVLLFLCRYFELGIVAFLAICWVGVGTPTIAQGGSGGGSQQLRISQAGLIVLLTLWGLRLLLLRRRGSPDRILYRTPVNSPIFVYLAIAIWSTVNSLMFPNLLVLANAPKQYIQVNILEVAMRILALGGLLMVANTLQGRALKAGAVAVLLPGIVTFFLMAGGFKPLANYSYLAFAQQLSMAVLAAVALSGSWTRPWVRGVCVCVVLMMVYWWFVRGADWVSGWLGPLVALSVIGYTAQRKLFWAGCAAVLAIVVLNFSYFYKAVYVSNFYGSGPTHDMARVGHMGTFTNDRTRMWEAAARYAENFPLGIGIGNFRSYENYFGRVDVWNTTVFTSAHGTYSQALSEMGWPGFIALLAIVYCSARMLRRFYLALPAGPAKTYMLGAWGGAIGVFSSSFNGDYLFPAYHNGGMGSYGACVYVWLVIGVCIAIARHYGLVWSEIATDTPAAERARVVAPVIHRPLALPTSSSAEEVAH